MSFAAAARALSGMAGLAFGWSPDAFWQATPDELAALIAALRGEDGTPPPTRDDMARMMEAFPDGG